MEQNGYPPPANAFRARAWQAFGKKIETPTYGAIGIKSRGGGGHVAFVVGKSRDGQYLYMLGGNQDDEVNIRSYDIEIWDIFVLPQNYDRQYDWLPEYTKEAANSGREG